MSMNNILYIVVCYDIIDDRKRAKVAKIMKSYGVRVQKSVFDCRITYNQYIKMRYKLEKVIDFEEDSIRYYSLCSRCQAAIQVSGLSTKTEFDDLIIV